MCDANDDEQGSLTRYVEKLGPGRLQREETGISGLRNVKQKIAPETTRSLWEFSRYSSAEMQSDLILVVCWPENSGLIELGLAQVPPSESPFLAVCACRAQQHGAPPIPRWSLDQPRPENTPVATLTHSSICLLSWYSDGHGANPSVEAQKRTERHYIAPPERVASSKLHSQGSRFSRDWLTHAITFRSPFKKPCCRQKWASSERKVPKSSS